jgi:hypothetical protein
MKKDNRTNEQIKDSIVKLSEELGIENFSPPFINPEILKTHSNEDILRIVLQDTEALLLAIKDDDNKGNELLSSIYKLSLLDLYNEAHKESVFNYDGEEEFDFSEFFYNLMNKINVELPNATYDGEEEELDFENHEILKLEKDCFEFCAGGDWQEPVRAKIYPDGNGDFICEKIGDEYESGLSEEELLKQLKKLNEQEN